MSTARSTWCWSLLTAMLMHACSVYDDSLLEPTLPVAAASAGGTAGTASSTESSTSAGSSSSSNGGVPTSDSTSSTASAGGSVGTGGGDTSSGIGGSAGGDSTVTSGGATGGTGGAATTGGAGGTGGTVGTSCGMPDCCPDDDEKLEPGDCGCGMPDTDSDSDGTADCIDRCENDPNKSEPGRCGCGIPEQNGSEGVGCVPLLEGLVHRYSFTEAGTEARDSAGDADGEVVGTMLGGNGSVVLDPDQEQYVDLPDGLISSLTNATIEVWFTWNGGTTWRRLFDFGSTEEGIEGQPGTGDTFVMFSPSGPDYPYATFNPGGGQGEVYCSATSALSSGQAHQLALSLDTEHDIFTIYLDGRLACATAFPADLSELDDVNNWIGRSQFETDGTFSGSVDEFRIYDFALSSEQVGFSADAGPDPAFLGG